jgi:uncharacterized protein YciW
MEQVDVQKIIDVLQEQRNEAYARLAQMTAYARQLEEKLEKQVVPDTGGKSDE